VGDIDTAAADSLKVLDPKWPIRQAEVELGSKRLVPARFFSTINLLHNKFQDQRNRGEQFSVNDESGFKRLLAW